MCAQITCLFSKEDALQQCSTIIKMAFKAKTLNYEEEGQESNLIQEYPLKP